MKHSFVIFWSQFYLPSQQRRNYHSSLDLNAFEITQRSPQNIALESCVYVLIWSKIPTIMSVSSSGIIVGFAWFMGVLQNFAWQLLRIIYTCYFCDGDFSWRMLLSELCTTVLNVLHNKCTKPGGEKAIENRPCKRALTHLVKNRFTQPVWFCVTYRGDKTSHNFRMLLVSHSPMFSLQPSRDKTFSCSKMRSLEPRAIIYL